MSETHRESRASSGGGGGHLISYALEIQRYRNQQESLRLDTSLTPDSCRHMAVSIR